MSENTPAKKDETRLTLAFRVNLERQRAQSLREVAQVSGLDGDIRNRLLNGAAWHEALAEKLQEGRAQAKTEDIVLARFE